MSNAVRPSVQMPFALRLPVELREELTALATQEQRSLAYILRRLVRLGLKIERERRVMENRDARS